MSNCTCGHDSNHDSGFCPGAKPEDDPCLRCGGKLDPTDPESIEFCLCTKCKDERLRS